MTNTLLLECDSIRETFREWHTEQESLDAQLAESLSALEAYQSLLDAWQTQLVRERDELQKARQQFEVDCVAAENNQVNHEHMSEEIAGELSAAREKISSLSVSLLARTEELRLMDQRRSELATELELNRGREKELKSALEEQQRALDQERAQRAEELRNLRELMKGGVEAFPAAEVTEERVPPTPTQTPRPDANNGPQQVHENPVLGSIVEQFGKLRQQRAMDRQVLRKAR